MLRVPKDSTDVSTYFVLRDNVNHLPMTGITVTGIDLYYVTYRAAISAKADATALAAADSAHSDNKAFEIGLGLYRIDWPDIWTDAVKSVVQLIVVCAGADTTFQEVEITGLPAVVAGATGGLSIERVAVTGAVATDGGNSATQLKTNLTNAQDDVYNDCLILLTSGTYAGDVKKVTDYNGTTKTITCGAFPGTPADGVTFKLINQ